MRILVANEPRLYREVFADAFREFRPHTEVITAEPDILDREVLRFHPDLVICDITPTVRAVAYSWIEIREENGALVFSSSGTWPAGTDVRLDDLLSFIDQSQTMIQHN